MKRFSFGSLRVRLIILVLLATIPALGITLYTGLEQRQIAADKVKDDAQSLAHFVSNRQKQFIEGAHQFLYILAQLPQVRSNDTAACSRLFNDLLNQYPHYLNIGAIGLDGYIFASAIPLNKPIYVADRPYFQRVLKTRKFTVGVYQIGRITGKPGVNLGYPVMDDIGKVKAVVFVALDLTWLNKLSGEADLPDDSTLSLIDSDSTILARYPEPEKWVGKTMPEASVFKTILTKGEGIIETIGADGVKRLYAFTSFGSTENQAEKIYLSIGIPSSAVFVQVNRILIRNLAFLLFISLLALSTAWFGGNLLVLRQLNPIVSTAKRLGAGDLSARTGIVYGKGELSQLAFTFDEMAESLEKHEAERKRAEDTLRESEKRYRQVVESATEIIYTVDEKGNFTYGNPAGLKVIGYSLQELRELNYTDLVLPDHRERVSQAYINQFRERWPTNYIEFPFLSKAGEIIWFGQNTSLVIEDGKVVGFDMVARDITERKQAEERLQERERYFRTLMYTLHEDIVVIDCDYRITDVNNTFLITTGKSREQVIGKPCYEISHGYAEPCDRHGEQCVLGEVFETGKSRNYKHVHMHGDGSKVYVDILLSPLKDDSGSVTHVVEAVRDVTDLIQAYEALRSSEEKYRTILENIEEGYYEVDIAGNFTFINDSMCRIYGYPKEELMGMNDRQYTDEENTKRLFQAFNKVYRTGEPHIGYDYEIIRKDGAKRYVEASILLQKDSSGKPLGFRGIIRDITERKRAEQALFDSEQRYRNLIENAPDVIFTLAPDGTITSFNPAFETITGWSRSEWLGKAFTTILRPEDLSRGLEFFRSVLKGEKTAPFELGVLGESGDYLTAEFTITPQTHDGSVMGVLGIARDITERKKAEEALRASESKYRTLIENVPQKIFLKDRNSVYISCNENYAQDLKIKPDEISGRTDYEFYPKELAEQYRADDKRTVEKGKTEEFEEKYIQNGQEVWVNTIKTPVKDEKDNLIGILGIFRDITERKRAEQEMAALQEQLRQSQKIEAIGRLAGGIAHDFNNLLTVIKGYSQLSLIELKEDAPLRGNIEEIKKASDKAADLTRQLLAFSRRQILEVKVLDLNTVLRDMDKMLHRLIGEDIELITLLADDLGRVKTDPGWVEQIIMNLAVNARDAMPSVGKLTIETANVELDGAYARSHIAVTPGRYVMLSVSDMGVGMTPEVRQQVFEPFFTTKEKGRGTGLGLSTVYGIVKQSGGNIWVYSEPGKGTTFKIYLPRVDEPLEELKEKVVKEELPRGSETILLVEDEEVVRKLAVRILKRQDYTVLEGSDGNKAIDVCKQHKGPIHLLLTDVVMPGMSGRELAEHFKPIYPKMKVLYMSGYTDNAITHHGVLEEGMNYLQKPFTIDGLARKVREVLIKT